MDSSKQTSEQKPKQSKSPIRGTFFLIGFLVVTFLFSLGISAGGWFVLRLYETLPTVDQLQNIEQPLVSRVYGMDGSLAHEFSIERRFWVSLEKIPKHLQNGVVAIEDRRFYSHWGIDVRRIFGAIIVDILHGRYAQGASTISQQLARNIYLTHRPSLIRKIREALTAIQLESCYTKSEILELYLNQVYLGAGVYGVQAASEHYFSKPVWELGLNECALISGLIQLPERYRPDKEENLERITNRRNTVLRAMEIIEAIDAKTLNTAVSQPVEANPRQYVSKTAPYFMEMVRQEVADRFGYDLLFNGGLSIHTTLDPVAQDSAEHGVEKQIEDLQKRLNRIFLSMSSAHKKLDIPRDTFLTYFDSIYTAHKEDVSAFPDSIKLRIAQMAVVGLDVPTGAVRVLIGGRNFETSKFNRAVQARRQPGSSFKPVVYTVALEKGYNPATVIYDQPITLMTAEGEWRPENYDHVFNGPVTLRHALAKSINLVAIQVLNKVGAQTVIDYARKMGLKQRMNPVPALAIGACEVTPMEITAAYAIYANNGIYSKPFLIEKIVDKNGRIIYEHTPKEKEVLSAQTAFLMSNMMKSVVCCGTGASIPGLGFTRPAAGKTGTTNDYSDAWFIGFTPQYTCGVWAGIDERRSMGRGVTGSHAAIPVWVKTMKPLHRNTPVADFPVPSGVISRKICKESHMLATSSCPNTNREYFLRGTSLEICDIHGSRRNKGNLSDIFGTHSNKKKKEDNKSKKHLMF